MFWSYRDDSAQLNISLVVGAALAVGALGFALVTRQKSLDQVMQTMHDLF